MIGDFTRCIDLSVAAMWAFTGHGCRHGDQFIFPELNMAILILIIVVIGAFLGGELMACSFGY